MNQRIKLIVSRTYGTYFNTLSFISGPYTAKRAFRTFCKVRKGRVLPGQVSFLEGAKHQKESIAGFEVQTYRWEGKGSTVLLVHGWESNTHTWHKLIGHLKENDFNIVAFDAPGHGYSEGSYLHVPLYSECLYHMIKQYNPQHLVAHSVGGLTAIYTLARHQETSVKKLVTIGAPSEFYEIMAHYRQLLKLNGLVMQALDDYVKKRFGFRIREFSGSHFAGSLQQKGLLIHDRLDTVAPYHASEQVHSKWTNSVLVSTRGFGHSMHQDSVNKQIVDFLFS
jgi:pimeloyl-ACP methyl ester carboxylesterase